MLISLILFLDIEIVMGALTVSYSVFEEQSIGTRIGNVLKDSKLDKDFPGGNNCQLFDMSNIAKTADLISINSSTCELFINARINREEICSKDNCKLQLSVFVAAQIWLKVSIEFLDINDHAPRFDPTSIVISIPEHSPIGQSFDLPLAFDPDQGQNSVKSYVMQPLIHQLDLIYNAASSLKLTVTSDLDYEQPSVRNLSTNVVACDWGSPKLCGNLKIQILVTDLNDNAPIFLNDNVTVEVMEDSAVDRLVSTVIAHDKDGDENGQVTYSINPSLANKQAMEFFAVNSTTGQLFLIKSIQTVDTPDLFKLTITAIDHGRRPLSTECAITIRIVDVNNHPPIISVTPTLGPILQISEGIPSRTTVGLVKVIDRDKGDNGQVSCELINDKSKATLEPWNMGSTSKTYQLLVTEPLDREEMASLNMSVVCTDHGVPPRTTERALTLLVIDVNEFEPMLRVEPSNLIIPENLALNTTVAKLFASDNDSDANISVKLDSNTDMFWLDSQGNIRLIQSLDRETRHILTLSAIAVDSGLPKSRTASLGVTINISDVNDNEPQLLEPRSFQLLENLGVSPSRIGQLKAFDPDLGMNGTVRFALMRATSSDNILLNNTFFIDEKNGSIFSLKPIDRETVPAVVLRVMLKDCGTPPLEREEVVHLTVVDENDNRPIWQFPNPDNCNINMSVIADARQYEHRPILITVIRVTDTDSPSNANITFKLLSVTSNNIPVHSFSLDPFSGHLMGFGSISEGFYIFQMQASDNGKPPLTSETGSLYLKVYSPKHYFFNSDNDRLSVTLIVSLGSVTCIICVSLVVAIIVVRRHRYGTTQLSAHCHNNDQNSVINESLAKWTEEQNQYLDSWGYQSQYCSYPMIPAHYKLSSIGEPLLPPPGPNDILSNLSSQPHMCSTMHLRRPINQDIDVSSADSGRGPSEEENFHSDGKMKEMARTRGRLYATLPTGTSVCACQNYGGMCNLCIGNLVSQYQHTAYVPSPANILDCVPKHGMCNSQNTYSTIDTFVTTGISGSHPEVLSANMSSPNNYSGDVSSFYNHTNV